MFVRKQIPMKKMKRSATLVGALLLITMISAGAGVAAGSGVVNINKATVEQLMLLPRVGPSVAGCIIEFREQNGSFKQATDLLLVKGIGDKTFELIEPFVVVTGETSLKEKVGAKREAGASSSG